MRQINDEVYVKDYTPEHKLCLGKIEGLWDLQGAPTKYVVHFTGSDGSHCGGTFSEDELYDTPEPALPSKFDIGDEVWYWYIDDGQYDVWYGIVEAFETDGTVRVVYTSYIDVEPFEDQPYSVRIAVQPEQLFETRLEAVVDAALHYQEDLDASVGRALQEEEQAKKVFAERKPVTDFKYKTDDEVYVVVPYASGAVTELLHGYVNNTPVSDNPHWYCLRMADGNTTMAPIAFTSDTPEKAARLYADSRYKAIMDGWIKRGGKTPSDIANALNMKEAIDEALSKLDRPD